MPQYFKFLHNENEFFLRKLFKGGNYMRKYSTHSDLPTFILSHPHPIQLERLQRQHNGRLFIHRKLPGCLNHINVNFCTNNKEFINNSSYFLLFRHCRQSLESVQDPLIKLGIKSLISGNKYFFTK